jgi:hypothetical protein
MSLPDHPSFPVAPPRLDEFSISQSAVSPLEACSGFRKHFCEFQQAGSNLKSLSVMKPSLMSPTAKHCPSITLADALM